MKRWLALLLCALGLRRRRALRADAVSLQIAGNARLPAAAAAGAGLRQPGVGKPTGAGAGWPRDRRGWATARAIPRRRPMRCRRPPGAPPTAEALLGDAAGFLSIRPAITGCMAPETPDRARLAEWGIGTYLSPGACSGQPKRDRRPR
ncbi:hypothetical protein M8494_19830 [Serratia ureilytica]